MKGLKSPKRIAVILIVIFSLLILGFLRESVFKNLNALLGARELGFDYDLPRYLTFLNNFASSTLVYLKWFFTLLFSALYLLFTIFSIYFLFRNKLFTQIALFVYIGIAALSALLIFLGWITGSSEKMYEFARYFMGMAQSPLILMILIPLFKLTEKENLNSKP